jgi:hypothetical protein
MLSADTTAWLERLGFCTADIKRMKEAGIV